MTGNRKINFYLPVPDDIIPKGAQIHACYDPAGADGMAAVVFYWIDDDGAIHVVGENRFRDDQSTAYADFPYRNFLTADQKVMFRDGDEARDILSEVSRRFHDSLGVNAEMLDLESRAGRKTATEARLNCHVRPMPISDRIWRHNPNRMALWGKPKPPSRWARFKRWLRRMLGW